MTDELPALRDRVRAPADGALPEGPEGIHWRALTVDDAATLTELAERISRRDHPTWSESLDEVDEELGHSWVEPTRDGVLAHDADGHAVAWGLVTSPPGAETVVRVFLSGGVDPARRGTGIGRRLLAWQQARAQSMLSQSARTVPAWIMSYAADLAPEHGRLLQRHGFEPARYFTTLECPLTQPPPVAVRPAGVVVEPFSGELSEGVRAAKNAAFADHWGSQPTSREAWESMQALPSFRPELSRIARVEGQVVGFVITEINEADWPRQGARSAYIGQVGTVREWRGRGLASALLAEVMQAYREIDLEVAVLDVDTENPTGALGVYTRLGFAPTARDVAYRVTY